MALGRFHFQALGLVPGEDEQFRLLRIRGSRPRLNLQWRRVTGAKEGWVLHFCGGNQTQGRLYAIEHPSVYYRTDGSYGWNLVVGKAFSNGDCRVRDRD